MKNNTYCSSFWNHQMISTAGEVKPCCRFRTDTYPTLNEKSIQEIFHSEFMNSLREKSLNGIPINGCRRCYEEQDNGKISLRQRINSNKASNVIDLTNPKINYLEVAISNDCNLACRICCSQFSHKIYDEELGFYGKTLSPTKKTRSNIDTVYELLDNLLYIKFTGGEPLMIKEHWELLQAAVDKDLAKNITLNYGTNCTIPLKQKHIDLWKHFKGIELCISLDSIVKEENEYQRHFTDHNLALANIKEFVNLKRTILPQMLVIGRPTISIMTIYHAPETIEWLFNVGVTNVIVTHLTFPLTQSITVLPKVEKLKIKEKFDNYNYKNNNIKTQCDYLLNYMFSENNSHLLNEFKKHMKFLDNSKNQSFKDSYPYFDF